MQKIGDWVELENKEEYVCITDEDYNANPFSSFINLRLFYWDKPDRKGTCPLIGICPKCGAIRGLGRTYRRSRGNKIPKKETMLDQIRKAFEG